MGLNQYSPLIVHAVLYSMLISASVQYQEMTVENSDGHGDICSIRKLKLRNGPNSALIIKQTRLNDHVLHSKTNFHCTFQITAPHPKDGIFAVIQQLVFRVNSNSSVDQCKDYVQFRSKDGAMSPKYCGRFNAALKMDFYFLDSLRLRISGNTFTDFKGDLEVTIFVSKDALNSDEEIDLSIVFTTFRYCADANKWHQGDWKPCGEQYKDVCIYKEFLNDGYVNCPYPGCVDEDGCSREVGSEKTPSSIGNKVFIGSISSLAIMFVLFILFVWACKKHKVFCWAQEFAHPSPTISTAVPRVEMIEQSSSQPQTSQLGGASALTDEDKDDLPPSYDSLFPAR